MKGTKPTELRDRSVDELTRLAAEKAENLFNLRIRRAAGTLESNADISATRRDLARVKTILAQKQSQNASAPKA